MSSLHHLLPGADTVAAAIIVVLVVAVIGIALALRVSETSRARRDMQAADDLERELVDALLAEHARAAADPNGPPAASSQWPPHRLPPSPPPAGTPSTTTQHPVA